MIKRFFQKYSTATFFLNAPLVIKMLIALITFPIVLANLPIADFGKWQFVIALQAWVLSFSAANITLASKRGIAKELNGTFFYAFLARLKLLLPVGILVLCTSFYLKIVVKDIFSILLTIVGLYLIFGYLFQTSFYEFLIAKKRFKEWCFWQIFITSISVIGSAIIAYFTKNIIHFISFQLGSTTLLSWIAWLRIVKGENLIESYKKGEIDKECVPYGLKLIPISIISITAGKLSHFIIGPFFGFTDLAIFSVVNNLKDKCAGIIKSSHPLLYADFAKIERKKLIKIINLYLIKIGIMGLLLTFGFIGVSWFYIIFFLPETFHKAIVYFAILSLGLSPGLSSMVLHVVLESHLRYKELSVVQVVSNLVKIILIITFGYLWQIIGICIALTISGWVSFGFYYLLTVKKDFVVVNIKRFSFLKKLSNF